MRVFVWQSFGTVRVMRADDPCDFENIVNAVAVAMTGWGVDKSILHLKEWVGSNRVKSNAQQERLILNFLRPHFDHETFQIAEFVSTEG